MDDESDHRVEYLDEWDSTLPPEPPRTTDRRLVVPFVLLVVGAIVVALAIGGAGRGLFVAPKLPVATGPATVPVPPYLPVDVATESAFTPAPPNDDVEAQPLIVTLEQTLPRTSDGILSYKVSVCVNATIGSAAGGRVPILRNFWTLVSRSTTNVTQTFVGCYILHLGLPDAQGVPPYQPIGIRSATNKLVANNADTATLMGTACPPQ
jgi:hypothetical protein